MQLRHITALIKQFFASCWLLSCTFNGKIGLKTSFSIVTSPSGATWQLWFWRNWFLIFLVYLCHLHVDVSFVILMWLSVLLSLCGCQFCCLYVTVSFVIFMWLSVLLSLCGCQFCCLYKTVSFVVLFMRMSVLSSLCGCRFCCLYVDVSFVVFMWMSVLWSLCGCLFSCLYVDVCSCCLLKICVYATRICFLSFFSVPPVWNVFSNNSPLKIHITDRPFILTECIKYILKHKPTVSF